VSTSNTISLQLDNSGVVFPEPEGIRPVVVALADDPDVLDALDVALGRTVQLIVAPSPERFADQLLANPAQLALLDCAAAGAELGPMITVLRKKFPGMTLIVSGNGREQPAVAPQLENGSVFRFVNKPVSAVRLKMVIEAALQSPLISEESMVIQALKPRSNARFVALAVIALAAIAGGCLWWFQLRSGAP
jgi:DNA-binding NtrC family response regulator